MAEAAERLACYDALARGQGGAPRDTAPGAPREDAPGTVVAGDEEADPPRGPVAAAARALGRPAVGDEPWFGILPYRRNYILPLSHNDNPNRDLPPDLVPQDDLEIKFQLSFQVPVWENLIRDDLDVYFGYTQLSYFQAYNQDYSSPFRETAYEPELGLHWQPGLELWGWRLTDARLAVNHQSNGRSEPASRSWNRILGTLRLERGDLSVALRGWRRIEEDGDDDDNPDITDFLGYGELFLGYDLGRHRLGLMVRNPGDHGAAQLDWSYPLTDHVRLYLQYFNGYGESLIDYDHASDRISAGFLFSEWP
jgi:phospholipase A1